MLCEDEGLGVVCDGMGGHDAGEVASRMAVDVFAERVAESFPRLVRGRRLSEVRARVRDAIREWTQDANAAIHAYGVRHAKGDSPKSKMGTTLALVMVVSDFAAVAHVGDSRVYRIRDGIIEQLTEDHTVVAKARRKPGDDRPPRNRKYVTRALGTKRKVEPDVVLVDIFPGDVFVLCSDGLSDLVSEEDIAKVLRRAGSERRRAVRALINLANKRGGPDNVTVVLAEVVGDDDDDDDTEELRIRRR